MSLNIEGKKEVVAEVSERLKKAHTVVLAKYRGLPVEDITVLRSQARASGVYLRVLKNTLARRAVKGTPFEKLADQMVGPLAYGISDDPVAAAKVLHEYSKTNEKLVIKGGAMPGHMMNAKEVGQLATMPGRESGSVTCRNAWRRDAPSTIAASSRSTGISARKLRIIHTANGKLKVT